MSSHTTRARRAFIPGGVISHLVPAEATRALCKADPWPDEWSFHVDDAKALPLCFDCLYLATRAKRKRNRSA